MRQRSVDLLRSRGLVPAVLAGALACLALACARGEVADRTTVAQRPGVASSAPSPAASVPAPELAPAPAPASAGGADVPDVPLLSFFALGDTGYGGKTLGSVATAMNASAEKRPVALALLLGDNFYTFGISSLEDERWRSCFEDAFAGSSLRIPFYVVLGNHDHRGRPDVEVAYTQRSERWKMPARWYTFTQPMPGTTTPGELSAQFFALDTDPIEEDYESAEFQAAWLRKELERSTARWKIVFGHHPMRSHGRHGGTRQMVVAFDRMFEELGVDLYVSGHDHDLQVLKSDGRWLQVVSGAGSSTRRVGRGDDTLFAASSLGFVRIGLGAKTLWIEVATVEEGVVFHWQREKD